MQNGIMMSVYSFVTRLHRSKSYQQFMSQQKQALAYLRIDFEIVRTFK